MILYLGKCIYDPQAGVKDIFTPEIYPVVLLSDNDAFFTSITYRFMNMI